MNNKKNKKIFLLGAYGQDNLGDDMLLQTFLERLEGFDIVVNSANPQKTSAEFNVKAVSTYGKNVSTKIRILRDADFVIFGGGSLLKDLNKSVGRWRQSVLINTLLGITLAKLLRKRVIMSAIGVGPLGSTVSRFIARSCARMADLVTVRDLGSKRLLEQVGFDRDIHLVADPVFLMPRSLSGYKNQTTEGQLRIGIAPTSNLQDGISYEVVVGKLSELCDQLIERHQAEVTFIPFQTAFNSHNDVVTNRDVVQGMRHKSRVIDMGEAYVPADMLQLINGLDLIVGMRLHSLIVAATQRVPFFAISYDPKTDNLIQEMGTESYSLSAEKFAHTKLAEVVDLLLTRRDEMNKVIAEKVPLMVDRAELNFNLLREFMMATDRFQR